MSTNDIQPPQQTPRPGHPVLPPAPPVPDDRVHGDRPGAEPYGESWLRPTLATTAEPAATSPTEPGPPGAPASSPRKPWLIAGLGATLLLASIAGITSWDVLTGGLWRSVEQTKTYSDDIRAITLNGGSGDVEVRTDAPAGAVEVIRRCNWGPGASQPTPDETVQGTTLQIASECSGFMSWCSIDYVLHVPAGTDVDLHTGSGDVALGGALGETVAETGSGDVTLDGGGEVVRLGAGSGDIEAIGVSARQVSAHTGSGSMDLDFDTAPDSVALEAGSGDVSVHVPQGAYAVDVTTGSGDKDVTVTNDQSSPDRIQVKTGSGDVQVAYN